MKKRIFCLCLVTALILSLVGCNKEPVLNKVSKENKEEAQVTIRYSLWGNEDRRAYTEEQIAAFMEKYSYIKVELEFYSFDEIKEKLTGIMSEGQEADVMQINQSWLSWFSPSGDGYVDLREYGDIIDLNQFSAKELSYGIQGQHLNALPIAMNTALPVYNETIYKEYGILPPKTWDELIEAARLMYPDGIYPLGADKWQRLQLMYTIYEQITGKSAFDTNGQIVFDRDGLKDTLEFLKKLEDNHVFAPVEISTPASLKEGKTAGQFRWISGIDEYDGAIKEAGGKSFIGDYICLEEGSQLGHFYKPASMLAMSIHSENKTEAAMLIDFLLNDGQAAVIQGTEKGIPCSDSARMALMENGDLRTLAYRGQLFMEYHKAELELKPEILERDDYISFVKDVINRYYTGEISTDQAADELMNQINLEEEAE